MLSTVCEGTAAYLLVSLERRKGAGLARTWCMIMCSKEVERELPMWSSHRPGKVFSRYAFFRSDPHVVNTCACNSPACSRMTFFASAACRALGSY